MGLHLDRTYRPDLLASVQLHQSILNQISEMPVEIGLGILDRKPDADHLLKVLIVPGNPCRRQGAGPGDQAAHRPRFSV
jgi:hypothetical protein